MKQDRIALRTSQRERERFSEAAVFSGVTLSSFLRQAALEKSDAILKNRDNLTLSDRDRDLFLEALENPSKPSERLKQAFKTYEEKKYKPSNDTIAKRSKLRSKRIKSIASKRP